MGLSKGFLGSTNADASAATIAATVSTIGYKYVVVFAKWESGATSVGCTDNKGSGSYDPLPRVENLSNLNSLFFWKKLALPHATTTITVSLGAARDFRRMAVWGVQSDGSGLIGVDANAAAIGNSNTPDAGSLVTTAPTVSFMGVGELSSVTFTPGSGWTEDYDNASFGASRADASPTTIDPQCTASAALDWSCNAVSFRELPARTAESDVAWQVTPNMGFSDAAHDDFYSELKGSNWF